MILSAGGDQQEASLFLTDSHHRGYLCINKAGLDVQRHF